MTTKKSDPASGVVNPASSGVLRIDKPAGCTSFDVVAAVRRALRLRRVGHTGTLDPMATGLMLVGVGEGTKLSPFLTGVDKRYRATVRLGVATDTLDADGAVVGEDEPAQVARVDADAFAAALPAFRGEISQRPPAYSAIKVDGRRLYARARAGEVVVAPLRQVRVLALELAAARPPEFDLDVWCSKGTYVRSLAADIAGALGLRGHLTALRRTAVGPFVIEDAIPLAELTLAPRDAVLLSLAEAVVHLPTVEVDDATARALRCGQRRAFAGAPEGLLRALDADGELVAILDKTGAATDIVRAFGVPQPARV